jgi:hypothetical protein
VFGSVLGSAASFAAATGLCEREAALLESYEQRGAIKAAAGLAKATRRRTETAARRPPPLPTRPPGLLAPTLRCCSNRQAVELRAADVTSSSIGESGWAAGRFVSETIRLTNRCQCAQNIQTACNVGPTSPPAGSPGLLLAYRLLMFAWGLFIGLRQLADKGRYAFVFYTGGCCCRPCWQRTLPKA